LKNDECGFTLACESTSRNSVKAKIHYTSFPVAIGDFPVISPQPVRNINDKSVTNPYNKLAREKVRCVCYVVSLPKFQLKDLEVGNKLATFPSIRGSYRETCVMDFGYYSATYRPRYAAYAYVFCPTRRFYYLL